MSEEVVSLVPRHLIGQALVQLDRVPLQDHSRNQEFAAPGTNQWVAETTAYLKRLVDESEKP